MGCDVSYPYPGVPDVISIHAARMGCDLVLHALLHVVLDISIHAARMGCDVDVTDMPLKVFPFQSTQPEWAATEVVEDAISFNAFQSTQPEWAATTWPP